MKVTRVVILFLSLTMASAHAHEFIVKPMSATAPKGTALDVAIYSTETYIQPHRLPPATTSLTLIQRDQKSAIPVKAVASDKVFRGSLSSPTDKGYLLAGTSIREREDKKGEKNSSEKARILRMETFSKAFVNLQKNDDIYALSTGAKLEILPLKNPAALKPGQSLKIKILLDGKPLAARVQATYDGFSEKPHGYVVRTESNSAGEAEIPLNSHGLWLIRTKYTSDAGDDGFDLYEASANIVFYLNN